MTTETDTMTIDEIYELLEERGISPTEFWSHAMGGDRAALPREGVERCIRDIRSRDGGAPHGARRRRDDMSESETERWVAYGSVRGWCGHRHRTAEAAHSCAARDQARVARVGRGAYSDRSVYALSSCATRIVDGSPYVPVSGH